MGNGKVMGKCVSMGKGKDKDKDKGMLRLRVIVQVRVVEAHAVGAKVYLVSVKKYYVHENKI